MIELSNLSLEINSKKFGKSTRKYIRISLSNYLSIYVESSITNSKKPSIYVNNGKLKWEEVLTIEDPQGHDVDFEIFDKHEFGYNPEELENMYGTMKIAPNQKVGRWNVFSIAEDHKKGIGIGCEAAAK